MYDEYRFGMKSMKRLREAKGLSQEKLAEMAHTSQPQIGRLESGTRPMTVRWAQKLAPLLGCRDRDLLPISEDIEDLSQKQGNVNPLERQQPYTSSGKGGKPHQEGHEVIPDPVLLAIGRLTIENERLKAELREARGETGESNPRTARGK
jgi:transcriptional regulator with XRE-family HTH domain